MWLSACVCLICRLLRFGFLSWILVKAVCLCTCDGGEGVYLNPSCHVCLCASARVFGCLNMMKMQKREHTGGDAGVQQRKGPRSVLYLLCQDDTICLLSWDKRIDVYAMDFSSLSGNEPSRSKPICFPWKERWFQLDALCRSRLCVIQIHRAVKRQLVSR